MDTKAIIAQVKTDAYEMLLELSKRVKQNESNNRVSDSRIDWHSHTLREIIIRRAS